MIVCGGLRWCPCGGAAVFRNLLKIKVRWSFFTKCGGVFVRWCGGVS